MRVDPEGRFDFLLGDDTTFKGFYVGFSGLRKRFLKGCRPIIGFDGCFLKTFLGGALLSAIAKDGNNQMFPICWAVVESENEEYWTWFLQILFEELSIIDGNGWSFISDQQKGLINAISKLTPHAEHRNCARHIYCNWKKNFKGQALKKIFWRAARSTYEAAHKKALEDMKAENEAAHADFMGRGRHKFCKLFLSPRPKSDMIDNNVAETFNGYIVKARGKHIIDMLEEIRCSLMERMHTKITQMRGVSDSICPRIRKKLEQFKYFSRLCQIKPSLNEKYQISVGEDGFVVDMNNLTCTCGAWQLTGVPCPHACASIHWKNADAASFVDYYYSVDRYLQAYQFGLEPINGKNMWLAAEGYPIKPPLYKKMPGRPKKMRKKKPEEENNDPSRLGKHGILMTCRICNTFGHNKRTCPQRHNPPVQTADKRPVRRGRPRKSNPSPIDPQRPSSSTKPPKLTSAEKRVRQRELRKVHEGFGVPTIEET